MKKYLAAVLLLLAGTSAMAQGRAARDEIPVPTAEELRVMHRFAGCVAREHTGEARRVLAMDFRTDEYRAALARLATGTQYCAPEGRLGFGGLLLAGGMAEHLFLRDHQAADAVRLLADRPSDPEARSPSEGMSYCLVRRSPATARAVLAAAPASSEETTAMDALLPAMSGCLSGAREVQMNRPGLRALLALAFYHLSGARPLARQAAPTSGS